MADSADFVANHKLEMRGRMKALLRNLDAASRAEECNCLRAAIRAWPKWRDATVVMAFLPLPGEVDLRPLLAEAIAHNVTVAVPVAGADASITPCQIYSLEPNAFVQDTMGVLVPRIRIEIAIDSLQVVLVPGLAFDMTGGRLGRGGGFYDRFLPRLQATTCTVGVGFALQQVSQLHMNAKDAKVGWLANIATVIAAQPVSPI